jgi:hypothetical protein
LATGPAINGSRDGRVVGTSSHDHG